MSITELIFEHCDGLTTDTVKEKLVFRYNAKKDFEQSASTERICEIVDFEMYELTGKTFETAIYEKNQLWIYLSSKEEKGILCYCVKYAVDGEVEVYEVEPVEGELME